MASNYIMHVVSLGDTIQLIGQKYEVNWTEIVEINRLTYPYVDATIEDSEFEEIDTVAKMGDKLIIPTNGLNVPLKTNGSSAEIEKYAFGSDLDIYSYAESENGTINLETSGQLIDNKAGDVNIVSGVQNLRQQLISRLGTEKGALLLHPEYGSNLVNYIGKRTTPELMTKIKLEIKECIMLDSRVRDITHIDVSFSNTTVTVDVGIVPIPPYSIFNLNYTYTA